MRTLIQAFRTKELRNKILFVLGMIIIYRIGSYIPAPGVDETVVNNCVTQMSGNSENFIGLVNLFSGGAMLQLSIFALGVMPVHHRIHRDPAAARGDPAFRGPAQGRPVR